MASEHDLDPGRTRRKSSTKFSIVCAKLCVCFHLIHLKSLIILRQSLASEVRIYGRLLEIVQRHRPFCGDVAIRMRVRYRAGLKRLIHLVVVVKWQFYRLLRLPHPSR